LSAPNQKSKQVYVKTIPIDGSDEIPEPSKGRNLKRAQDKRSVERQHEREERTEKMEQDILTRKGKYERDLDEYDEILDKISHTRENAHYLDRRDQLEKEIQDYEYNRYLNQMSEYEKDDAFVALDQAPEDVHDYLISYSEWINGRAALNELDPDRLHAHLTNLAERWKEYYSVNVSESVPTAVKADLNGGGRSASARILSDAVSRNAEQSESGVSSLVVGNSPKMSPSPNTQPAGTSSKSTQKSADIRSQQSNMSRRRQRFLQFQNRSKLSKKVYQPISGTRKTGDKP
jgi:hypothetical protein